MEHSRIFAPLIDELVPPMLAQPSIRQHLFELYEEDLGFQPPRPGLLVVRVPDHWWDRGDDVRQLGPGVLDLRSEAPGPPSPWSDVPDESLPAFLRDEEFHRRFRWLATVAPPTGLARWLAETAARERAPLGYYHWMERGDDLYYEVAYLFGTRGLEAILARQTFLVDTSDDEEAVVLAPEGRAAFEGSAFQRMLRHLGSPAEIQYFPPDDDSRFDWERCRVDPAEYAHVVR